MPESDERIGAKSGNHLLAEYLVEMGITEHRRDIDGKIEQQSLHHLGLVENPVLKRADCRESFSVHPFPQAPPYRCVGVLPEVEAVLPVYPLEEQVYFDLLQLGTVLWRRSRR